MDRGGMPDMTIMTRNDLQKTEEYYFWVGYKDWHPFPHKWTEQDIYQGSRKIIVEYFKSNSN